MSSFSAAAVETRPARTDRPVAGHRSFVAPARVRLFGIAATAVLAGCAGVSDPTGLFKSDNAAGGAAPAGAATPPAALPQRAAATGPSAPTAVVEDSYTLDGAIMPVARGQTRVETRADRQRIDGAVTFDNWLIRRFAGDGRTATIVRVDRGLVWTLDPAKKTYVECPITGCADGKPGDKPAAEKKPDEPAAPSEPKCPVRVATNDLKVDATAERRTVNGFETRRYAVAWTLALQDDAGRVNRNEVRMDLWTTPATGAVRDVQAITTAFERRHAAALTRGEDPVGRYLPSRVTGAMSLLFGKLDAKDQRTLQRFAAEMRKVEGYPIVTTMAWTTQGSVCGDSGPSAAATAGGIGSMLGGMLGGRKDSGAPAPLITFNHEVQSIGVTPVADAEFSPPPDFQRTK